LTNPTRWANWASSTTEIAAGLSGGSVGPSRAEPIKAELIPCPATLPPRTLVMLWAFMLSSAIRGKTPVSGVIAWIGLLEVNSGKEQPVDLEDWSAQETTTLPGIAPGQTAETEWRLRLIQSGSYRIAVMAAATGDALGRNSSPVASPFAAFTVASKPVVETGRVLPIASGVPLVIGTMLLWRAARGRGTSPVSKDVGQ
jgi:hypothetical protein